MMLPRPSFPYAQVAALTAILVLLTGCGTFTIVAPPNGGSVPAPVSANVTWNVSSMTSIHFTVDGQDKTSLFSINSAAQQATASLPLVCGSHSLVAAGDYTFISSVHTATTSNFTVLPSDTVLGLPPDPGQGNYYPFGGYSGRFQEVYTASAFPGTITIRALKFYNTQATLGATSLPSGTWTVALSTTTSADWNRLSPNFDANVGSNNTTVFTGNLSQPWSFPNTLTINLSTPFTYVPANGNLLMDVLASNISTTGPLVYFDTTGYNGGAENGSTIIGHVDVNGVTSGYGLVTGFTCQ